MITYKRRLLVSSMLLLLVEPAFFSTLKMIDKLYTYGGFLCVVFLIVLFLLQFKLNKINTWIFLFFSTSFLSTVIGSHNLYLFLGANYASLGMCLLFAICLEKDPAVLIESFSVLEIFVYINLITVLVYPEGMYNNGMYDYNWFLGYKNSQIRTILPILSMSLINSYKKFGYISFKTWTLICAVIITMLRIHSATAVVGIFVFLFILLMFHQTGKKLPKFVSLKNGVLATVILFLLIIVLKLQDIFQYLIVNILGKDLTFTSRSSYWDYTLLLIRQQPIWGYGYFSGDDYAKLFSNRYMTHPHNYIMYILMSGGLVLLAVVFWGYWNANKTLEAYSDDVCNKIILFTLFSFLIMGLMESLVGTILLYPMLILGMKADKIASISFDQQPVYWRIGKHVRFVKSLNIGVNR